MKKTLALCLAAVLSVSAATTAFAGTKDAYFFGNSKFLTEMKNVRDHIENELKYNTEIYTDPTVDDYSDSYLNSGVLYVAGHGNRYSIETGGERGICIDGRANFKNVENTGFSKTEMAIMAACKAGGDKTDYETSLGYKIYENGANYVLAWTSSPNAPILADYTERFAYYVSQGNRYLDAIVNTTTELNSNGALEGNPVFDSISFGNVNDTLPAASTRAAKRAAKVAENPVLAYVNNDMNQKIIEEKVSYKTGSVDFDAIEQYVKENVDAQFALSDYTVEEFAEEGNVFYENGLNLLSFRLTVGGIPSNYGFTVLCIDDEAKLITFTDNYDDVTVDTVKVMPAVTAIMDDEAMKEKAIKADGFDYEVDEQYIEKYFDVSTGKVVNSVNTVYVDEYGCVFCTEHKI